MTARRSPAPRSRSCAPATSRSCSPTARTRTISRRGSPPQTPASSAVLVAPRKVSPEFVDAVSPQFAILFAGSSAREKPSADLLSALASATILRTDERGDIEIVVDRADASVQAQEVIVCAWKSRPTLDCKPDRVSGLVSQFEVLVVLSLIRLIEDDGHTSEAQMKRVTGIGGIFFNANDPVTLRAWSQRPSGNRHPGIGEHVHLGRCSGQSDKGNDRVVHRRRGW